MTEPLLSVSSSVLLWFSDLHTSKAPPLAVRARPVSDHLKKPWLSMIAQSSPVMILMFLPNTAEALIWVRRGISAPFSLKHNVYLTIREVTHGKPNTRVAVKGPVSIRKLSVPGVGGSVEGFWSLSRTTGPHLVKTITPFDAFLWFSFPKLGEVKNRGVFCAFI